MRNILIIVMAALCFAGCAVVHVYVTFPEEKIERAAEDLLAPPSANPPVSRRPSFRFTREAYAQESVRVGRDLVTDSPGIREAKQKMDTWRKELDEFKSKGFIGETNEFSVVLRELPSDAGTARDARRIVRDENRERRVMMDELIRINNVAPNEQETFRRVFASVMQRYSPAGTWIQDEEGDWSRK